MLDGTGGDAAPLLLHAAQRRRADILVAGAFGHPRLQEFIFGGTTRSLLNPRRPVPVPVPLERCFVSKKEDVQMSLSRIVMRLARNPGTEFAGGDDHRGLRADRAADRRTAIWTRPPTPRPSDDCTVRRFAPDEDAVDGRLSRRGERWFFTRDRAGAARQRLQARRLRARRPTSSTCGSIRARPTRSCSKAAAGPTCTWPADLYLEGSDQHRGWFQSSLLEAAPPAAARRTTRC